MKLIFYFRHWYIDECDVPTCSGWQNLDWWKYKHAWHRDDDDQGDDGVIILLKTEKRQFENKNKI